MSVFLDRTVAVDPRFFVVSVLPVAILVAISLHAAFQGLGWWWFLLLTGVAGVAVVSLAGLSIGVALLAPAAASMVLVIRALLIRRWTGRALVSRLAHLGMAVFLVGVAGTSLGDDFTGSMRPGETIAVSGHEVTLEAIEKGEAERYVFVRADFSVDGARMSPEIRAYEDQGTPVAEPVLRSSVVDDVIIAISLLFPDEETVEVSVFVRPLVMWVWLGAVLMGLAGLLALFWRGGAVSGRRRRATTELRRGGTTSEAAAR